MIIVVMTFNQRVQRTFDQDRHKCICISLFHVPTRLQKENKMEMFKAIMFVDCFFF